jgi:hypothetical protein
MRQLSERREQVAGPKRISGLRRVASATTAPRPEITTIALKRYY